MVDVSDKSDTERVATATGRIRMKPETLQVIAAGQAKKGDVLAIVLNLLIGALIGIVVPLILEKLGRDPAMGSSVLLTFSTDSMGFFIFLGLATLFF